MSDLANSLYNWLYFKLELRTLGLALGLGLMVAHAVALLKAPQVTAWLKKFPRNRTIGSVLLTIDLVWALILITSMDLGEFHTMRKLVQIIIPLAYLGMIYYVEEFLAARALGILLLLAACPVLDAAFLKLPVTRLLIPTLAYVWIILGLFWVGMPYLMRDHIAWASQTTGRWRALCTAGVAYGLALFACALFFYKS